MSAHQAVDTQGGSLDRHLETKVNTKSLAPGNPYIFKHAPPKPDDDPWEILLKPELEADTTRCNAWKDEVQNLLIFAGLFSAVVTAFVIESYKFLQPDPSDAVVGLLFHIANSLNSTSPLPASVIPTPFSQTSSSIRINIFWFLSLIVSLTTVLVGTVSLQWLREHQSYPDVSSKEKVAIFHMRSEALNVWYVPQIFSALPVLLQGALALFLAGLIDFVLPLGGPKLTIPVCVIIGLTLLFLAATTVLPTCQGFLFLTGFYPYSNPPSLCVFKSPQSRVLLSIFTPSIRALSFVIFHVYKHLNFHPSMFRRHTALPYLQKVLQQSTWPNLDQAWLRLRDAYHQCILDNNPGLHYHQRRWSRTDCFPVSDITQYLVKSVVDTPTVKDTEAFLGATIHCFQETSASIWMDNGSSLLYKARHNRYFEQLHQQPPCSISKFLLYNKSYKIHGNNRSKTLQMFTQDQMFYFLDLIHKTYPLPKLRQYQLELWSQIMSNIQTLHLIPGPRNPTDSPPPIPTLFEYDTLGTISFSHSSQSPRFAAVADMLNAVFKSAASHRISQDQFLNSLCTHPRMVDMFYELAYRTHDYLQWAQEDTSLTFNQQRRQAIDAQYISPFKFVAGHLNNEISYSKQNSKEDAPSVLFYLASIFMWRLLDWESARDELKNRDSSFGQGLRALLKALLQYRTWILSSNERCDALETRFKGRNYSVWKNKQFDRYSDKWWSILFEHDYNLRLKSAKQRLLAMAKGRGPDFRLNPSSQDGQKTADVVTTPARPSSPSTFPRAVDNSPTLNVPAPNNDIVNDEVLHVDPQPVSLARKILKPDDHNDNRIQQSLSDSLSTAKHSTATNEVLDPIANPPLPQSQLSLALPAIHPSEGDRVATEMTLQAPLPTYPPLSSDVNTAPQQFATNVIGDGQVQIQAGERHVMINVGSPVDCE